MRTTKDAHCKTCKKTPMTRLPSPSQNKQPHHLKDKWQLTPRTVRVLARAAKRHNQPTADDSEAENQPQPDKKHTLHHHEIFEHTYGQLQHKKDNDCIRIGTLNVRHLPFETTRPHKYDALRNHIMDGDYDMLGFNEIGKNWSNIKEEFQLQTTLKRWWQNCSVQCAWLYDHNHHHEKQIGGTASIIINKMTSYIKHRGSDSKHLGRWSWYTIEATQHQSTTIISLYRPVNSATTHTQSAKMQQYTALREKFPNITDDPLCTFDKDLEALIQSKLNKDHQIIVMGDFNQDVSTNHTKSRTKRMLDKLGIREVILEKYGSAAPSTHINGQHPIDGIFATNTIHIRQGGYLPGNIHVSDHRTLWIDVPKSTILGDNYADIIRPPHRTLQISNPTTRNRFNKAMEGQLKRCKVLNKLRTLHDRIKSQGWDPTMETHYEICDNLRFNAIQCADKKSTQQRGGGVPFSDTIKLHMGRITMWELIYTHVTKRGQHQTRKRYLLRKAKKWKFEGNIHETNRDTIRKEITKARQDYKLIRKDAKQQRLEYLTDKAMAMAAEDDKPYQSHLKSLIQREAQRTSFRRIKGAQGKYNNLNITYIEQGPDTGPRTIISDKEKMEHAIKNANEAKLQQADNTPLREEPLCSIIDESHLNYERWERILTGEFNIPNDLDLGARLWLKKMREGHTAIPEIPIAMDTQSYKESWSQMKEQTSSAPGIHFGHFKATNSKTPIAAEVHALLAEIPMLTGYSPRRWRQCTDAMLRKKANDIRPEKLRLVTLMASDFNHNNKLIGRHIMAKGELHGRFATEQFGSRKHCSAALHALNKVLSLDNSKHKREACVVVANDAVSCYDRIVLAAAYCSMIRFGVTKATAQSMINTIGNLAHSIRTAHGDSTFRYGGHRWNRLPHGVCQGNGAGPAIWACVSSPLFDILREQGYGAKYVSPIKGILFNLAGFAFVDDADLIQTPNQPTQSVPQLIQAAQNGLKLWEECLRTTGGAIDPLKSDWVLLQYQWTGGHWNLKKGNSRFKLKVRNKHGHIQTLKQLPVTTARETLGCWIAPDGNQRKQKKVLTYKAKDWGQRIRSGFLSRSDTLTGFKTTIMMTLKYPLLTTTLNRTDCSDILSPLLTLTLPKMGLCSRMRRLIIHMPKSLNGLGVPDLWTLQGTDHIKALLDHGGTTSATGQLLQNSFEQHILHLGKSDDIMQLSRTSIRHLEPSWIKHTLQFLQRTKITIDNDLPRLKTWADKDNLIMDIILPSKGTTTLTMQEIDSANRCRKFLKVTTFSDITDTHGTILPAAWQVHTNYHSISADAYDWPTQVRPSTTDILAWQRALRLSALLQPNTPNPAYTSQHILPQAWTHATWWWDNTEQTLWQQSDLTWIKWTEFTGQHTRTSHNLFTLTQERRLSCNIHWTIATVRTITDATAMFLTDTPRALHKTNTDPGRPTIPEWILQNIQYNASSIQTFTTQLREGTAKVISDGSYKLGISTSAFTTISHDTPAYLGTNAIPGSTCDQNSYRSELGGIYGNTCAVNKICADYHIVEGSITAGCDSTSALWNAFGNHPINTRMASRDLIAAIRYQRKLSPLTWTSLHVKGHQDDDSDATLDEWAQGNIMADLEAKQARERTPHPPHHEKLPGETWRLILNSHVVVSDVANRIYQHCYSHIGYQYWIDRGRINPDTFNMIDWTALQKATDMTPEHRLHYISKNYAGYNATGKVMLRRKQWPKNECPRCKQEEDHQHIIRCPDKRAQDQFITLWGDIDDWINTTSTAEMGQAVYTLLSNYRSHDHEHTVWQTWSPGLQATIRQQYDIGHRSFTEGMLGTEWARTQQQHLDDQMDNRRSAKKWVATLTMKLWNLNFQMWKHRNHILHHNEETQSHLYSETQIQTLRKLYTQREPTMPHINLQLFSRPIDDAIQMKPTEQRRFIRQLKAAIAAHKARSDHPQAQALRAWLAPD